VSDYPYTVPEAIALVAPVAGLEPEDCAGIIVVAACAHGEGRVAKYGELAHVQVQHMLLMAAMRENARENGQQLPPRCLRCAAGCGSCGAE
jgi:hypothetical protein